MMAALKLYYALPVAPMNPRGARAAAEVFGRLFRGLQSIAGRLGPGRVPSVADEVRALRDLASQVRLTDPRMADEWSVAADRYEWVTGR